VLRSRKLEVSAALTERATELVASERVCDILRLEKEALLKRVVELESHNAALTESATELAEKLQTKKEVDYQILMTHQALLAGILDMEPEFRELFDHCKPFTMTSVERLYSVYKTVEYIAKAKISGDVVECGVWRGGSCMLIALYSSGCEWNYNQQRQAMGEYFPPNGEMRDVQRIERVQNASGAREDATLEALDAARVDSNAPVLTGR